MRTAFFLLLLSACDLSTFAAKSTADVFERAGPALDQHWDVELAGEALPSTLVQLEGLLRVVPDHEATVLSAARGYASYAYGWVEDEAERLADAGDRAAANRARRRSILLYERGASLGQHYADLIWGDDFEEARQTFPTFREWLEELDEDDAEALWWVGYTWGQHINAAHPREAHPERTFAIAMVRRSVELDPSVYGASGTAFLAYVATRAPGTTIEGAERAWRLTMERTQRRNLLALVIMARTYAVRARDRDLYRSLLLEVLEAEDIAPEMRLSNMIAKRRADRYLRNIDAVFR